MVAGIEFTKNEFVAFPIHRMDKRTNKRLAKWRAFGPKIVIISDLATREWSVHLTLTESDERDLLGQTARDVAISQHNGRSGEVMISTRFSGRTSGHWQRAYRPNSLYGENALDRWCIFIRPVSGSTATERVLRDIERSFVRYGFAQCATSTGDMEYIHTLVAAASVDVVDIVPEPREICAD